MLARAICVTLLFAVCCLVGLSEGGETKKKRTGSLTGEIKSTKASPNGKNQIIEVLAPGEEKARPYRVQYDPKVKGPIAEILTKVRAAKVGDRVQLDWIDTGEGLAITAFEVLKKSKDDDKK